MDNELFELSRGVSEKTGWETEQLLSHRGLVRVPLYTSDYLLEKLLQVSASIQIYRRPNGLIDLMWLPKKPMYDDVVSDTPLKALLKLTLALIESGELVKED